MLRQGFRRSAVRLAATAALSAALVTTGGCDFGEPAALAAPRYACFQIADPYAAGGGWHRGNFHMHSSHSDGAMSGSKLIELYQQYGYSVLSISDHNQYGDQDGGVAASQQVDSLVHDWNGDGIIHPDHVFGSGREAYVRDWTQPALAWVRDGWQRRLTADWKESPIVIPGAEATWGGNHVGLIGHPGGRIESPTETPGYFTRVHEAGGLIYLAHPGDWNATPYNLPRTVDLRLFDAIEIMNGLRLTKAFEAPSTKADAGGEDRECGANVPYDATPLWDGLLSRGWRVWGMANDDSHTWVGAPNAFPFSAFNMIRTADTTAAGFIAALRRGSFYGSTGIFFVDLGVTDGAVTVWAPEAERIRFIGWGGRVLQETTGPHAGYHPQGDEGYVRVEASAAPGHNPWPRQAWSQPFWIQPANCKPGTHE